MELWEVALILMAIYFANEYFFNYWTRRKFPQLKPIFPFGDVLMKFLSKDCFGVTFAKTYEKYKNSGFKAIGFYSFYKPQLLLLDPELIQDVLVRDFHYFHDRGNEFVDDEDPLTHHLFFLTGKKWCDLRSKLTPAFTSGKLKGMFPIIRDCADILKDYLMRNVTGGHDILNVHDILIRYNTSIASSVEFGVENDCINDRENIFFQMGLKISETSVKSKIQSLVLFFFPKALKYARMLDISSEYTNFFVDLVKAQIEYREKNKEYQRKDFMQLLIQLMKQGYVASDKNNNNESAELSIENKKLSFNEVVSQAFIFYIGGLETTSMTMFYLLFELSRNPQIQEKLQEEIDQILGQKSSDEINFDLFNDMKYLDCCISETLRKYPSSMLFRNCNKDYEIKGTDMVIEKGTIVFIPTLGIHRDSDIFENALQFMPERFLDSSNGNSNRRGLTLIPFGGGPRICIGMRLAKLQMKIGLAMILSKFSVELHDKSFATREIEFDKDKITLHPKDSIKLKLVIRK